MTFTLSTFYRSKQWTKFREYVINERLARDGDIVCEHCKKAIINSWDIIAHHSKTYLTEQNVNDYNISLNPENIALVHHNCHNKIHEKGFKSKEVIIVFGSPRSGKSTFVNEVAGPNDLIIDIDRLFEAINNSRSNKLLGTVMDIHRGLLDTVRVRKGQWQTCYIITTSIYSAKRIKDLVDPKQVIHINTDKETCYQRAKEKIDRYEGFEEFLDRYWEEVESNPLLLEELIN